MGVSTRLPAGSAAAARRVTGSCGDFTLDRVKFRVVCRGNLEKGLESDRQVGIDNVRFRIKTTFSLVMFYKLPIFPSRLHKVFSGIFSCILNEFDDNFHRKFIVVPTEYLPSE